MEINKVEIAGLKVDAISKIEFLTSALQRIKSGQKTFAITPYSEFLSRGFKNPKLLEIFNAADFSLADGIGIFWAKKYLEIPLTAKSFLGKILQSYWQLKYSLAAIIFNPSWIKSALPEKIVGADLVWDLTKLSAENNLSIFLLGGFGNTAELTKQNLISKYPNIKISFSNKNPNNQSIITDINSTKPDILLVAYGPVKQETWIYENLSKLDVKLAMGVGGTFDYIAETKTAPNKFIRYSGFEWLWRLFTQPSRFKRIMNATFGLMWGLWHYKVFNSYPLRPNVAVVVLNVKNEVLVCQRNPNNTDVDIISTPETLAQNGYWQFPQGGVDNGENLIDGAKREALEETGLKNLEFIKTSQKTHAYFWNNALRNFWRNRHKKNKGQIQNIVYFKFNGAGDSVRIDNNEFVNYKWVPIPELVKTIHPERNGLTQIVAEDLLDMSKNAII